MGLTTPKRWMWIALGSVLAASPLCADEHFEELGYTDLINRVGQGNEPTGAGILLGQTEAPSNGNYGPNVNDSHFVGKTFVFRSGNTGLSSHANTVGRHAYGTVWSLAPGLPEIHLWEANDWVGAGFLRLGFGGSAQPLEVEVDLFNHSWIGNAGGSNNEALRRVDFSVNDQNLMYIVGVGNGVSGLTSNDILLSHAFNVISVGRSNANHHRGNSLGSVDGPGRMIPQIVAPETATSFSTAIVSGMVADLIETARGIGPIDHAERSEVIKATLFAGATHRAGWSNNPDTTGPMRGKTSTPLDPIYGVDQANINTSHLILTGLEQDGSSSVPTSGSKLNRGWDLLTLGSTESRYYRFEVADAKDEVSVVVTWNRQVVSNFGSWSIPDIDLELFGQDGQGQLVELVGSNGLGVFEEGNVLSSSLVDNVEHLYLKNLQPGAYVLRVTRTTDGLGDWDAAVAWFYPPDLSSGVTLTSFEMITGVVLDGDLDDLRESDDAYLHTRSGFGQTFVDLHNMEVQVNANTQDTGATTLDVAIESRIDQSAGNAQIRLRNWQTGSYDLVRSHSINMTESTVNVTGLDASKYVDGAGNIELRIKHIVFVPFIAFTFQSFIDQVDFVTN